MLFARADETGELEELLVDDEPPSWFPLMRRARTEEERRAEERLSDLRELADRSRISALPPESDDLMLDAPPSLRAAIRTVQLFAVPVEEEPPPREWLPPEKPVRGKLLDRAAMIAVIACSALVGIRFMQERPERLAGNTRLTATAIAAPALAYAIARAHEAAPQASGASKADAPIDTASVRLGQTPVAPVSVASSVASSALPVDKFSFRRGPQKSAIAAPAEGEAVYEAPAKEPAKEPEPAEAPKPKAATSLADAMAAAVGK